MDLRAKIVECQTIDELMTLENLYVLDEHEQELVFDKKVEIICRIAEWGMENERLGLVADLTDTWTPEQRERFVCNWQDDEPLLQIGQGQKRSYDETGTNDDESWVDTDRGQGTPVEEVNDGTGTSTDEISDNSVFTVTTS